jgi:trehalose-6-phosphatase
LQFDSELASVNAQLAEHADASADAAAEQMALRSNVQELAKALAVAVESCRSQKFVAKILRNKLAQHGVDLQSTRKERDVLKAQVRAVYRPATSEV